MGQLGSMFRRMAIPFCHFLRSKNAHAMADSAIMPKGTPTPAPMAVSCEKEREGGALLEQFAAVDEFAGVEIEIFERAARPKIRLLLSSVKGFCPLGQTTPVPLLTGLPQQ